MLSIFSIESLEIFKIILYFMEQYLHNQHLTSLLLRNKKIQGILFTNLHEPYLEMLASYFNFVFIYYLKNPKIILIISNKIP